MKKFVSVMAAAAAILFSQALGAQNLMVSVQNDTVWFGAQVLSYDAVGALVEEKAPQNLFVYVDCTTPFVLCQDVQAAVSMNGSADVVFMNPDKYADRGREYGPFMAVHNLFEDWALYDEDKKKGAVLELSLPCEDPLKELQEKEYNAILLKVDRKSTVGDVYGFIRKAEEKCPNIVLQVPEGDYSMGGYFRVAETDPSEYEFDTYPCVMGQAWTVYRKDEIWDPVDFAKNLVAFESITKITAPGAHPGKGRAVVEMTVTPLGTLQDVKIVRRSALPGLDEVIVRALYEARSWWVPQFKKEVPINVKVTVPVEGEIGAY